MADQDLIDLNEWMTVEDAAKRLADQGVAVGLSQLYQRAGTGATRRKRVVIQSREIVGRLCLLIQDVDRYGESLKTKRQAKQQERRNST